MKDYWKKLSFVEKVKLIFFSVIGLLIFIFALLNWKDYSLNLIFDTIEIPVTILILVSMFGGYAYARVYGALKSRKQDKEINYLKGELAATREKLRKEPLELKSKVDDKKSDETA